MPKPKLLLVDDDVTVCYTLAEILNEYGYDCTTETNGLQVLSRLQTELFDAVLLDLMMPEISGIELLQRIKEPFPDLPAIIITGFGSIETAVESMQAGAADFVTKPIDMAVLDIRIKKAIEHEQTRRLAFTDGLTSLANYRSFHTRLQQELERADRYHRPLSLIMLDIDYFKAYNDTHGHPQGDAILAQVAKLLKQTSRSSDMVARYGGEEFALILPETDQASAEALGNRLREEIEQFQFAGEEHLPSKILTISVGIATHGRYASKEALIAAADAELYRAKREGRNRVCAMT
ncbi:GGDEF domain-containing response regulator [Candidatus Entotheonella palauensis]|nr:diguanylate cyclase [Candidatus Entotheonella palauensis]